MLKSRYILLLLASCLLFSCQNGKVEDSDAMTELRSVFENPPQSARPLVWWHWMNGNISKDGIRKDLEWMHRVGIGGFHVFDANMDTPQIVPRRIEYMSPDWKDAFGYALSLADSLEMDVGIASSPGFSHTGGPWVSEADAMKKIVWREMRLSGGRHFRGKLPDPFRESGKFQDLPLQKDVVNGGKIKEHYYEDIAVVAVRVPDSARSLSELGAEVGSSGGNFSLEQLSNDSLTDYGRLPVGDDGFAWIQYSFNEPQTMRSLTVVNPTPRQRGHSVEEYCSDSLQVSDDGRKFRTVFGIPIGSCEQQTISFEPVTAKFFRLKHRNPKAYFHYSMITPDPDPEYSDIAMFRLWNETRINHAEEKAAFAAAHDTHSYSTPEVAASDAYHDAIDVSSFVRDGILDWDVPEGEWLVFRFGASLTGKKNHPASKEATGLEVDKLDPDAWERYFRFYLDMYREASGGLLGKRGIRYLLTDSYEAGAQNWTHSLAREFRNRRGYDMIPWMPVLTGAVLESTGDSERFLCDFRITLGELFAENYSRLSRLVRDDYGMAGCFVESHENGRVFVADGMSVKKSALYPMSAMWVPGKVGARDRIFEGKADIRESASVAHIYGQNLVAAESLTSIGLAGQAYSYCPENLKHTADLELACGLNRFVIHDSAHQPSDSHVPGLGLGVYGQWFNRHECWAEQAGEWVSYLSRSCALLQKGVNVADILYLYGDDNNVTGIFSHSEPQIPAGFNYDFVNSEALLSELVIDGKELISRGGTRYRLVCLDPSINGYLSAAAKEKLDSIRKNGIPVVYAGDELEKACSHLDPDFSGADSLLFVHRKQGNADIYWVFNSGSSNVTRKMKFRTRGLSAELWNAESGKMTPASYSLRGKYTLVDLSLAPGDAVFVVFANPARRGREVPSPQLMDRVPVTGPWHLSFQTGRGAPDSLRLDKLTPLNESATDGVRYFSGTVSYKTHFCADTAACAVLSLGKVCNIAEVYVNGKEVATLWRTPFSVDVSHYLKTGDNQLEIKVTNLWVNRLIGDSRKGVVPLTYTPVKFFGADDTLLPSGLLGPVELQTYDRL